jgi:hypothetical protein
MYRLDIEDKEAIRAFTAAFKATEIAEKLEQEIGLTIDHCDQILEETQRRFNRTDVSMDEMVRTAESMRRFKDLVRPVVAVVPEPEPKLTPSQLAWQEMTNFTAAHSVAECKARARSDAAYSSFLTKNLAREMGDGNLVADGVVSVGTNTLKQSNIRVDESLREFARTYRYLSVEDLKRKRTLATNPQAQSFREQEDRAIQAGLL